MWVRTGLMVAAAMVGSLMACHAQQTQTGKVRRPAVAGTFYPSDPKQLASMVDGFLAMASVPQLGEVVALIAPHAGYIYSGPVAGFAYATLKGRQVERVVVISPSHVDAFPFSAVYDGEAYETPLGRVPVDQEFARSLVKASKLIQLSDRGHRESGGRAEHALEVQLPFLQRALGSFKLVPVVMGTQSYEACRALGVALAQNMKAGNTIIVASSDLSHYHPYDRAVSLDKRTLRAIEHFDYLSLWRNLEQNVWEACGGGPIVAVMIAAERLGAKQAKVLKYANSGDTAGDKSQVVGYGAVAIYKGMGDRSASGPGLKLTPRDVSELFRIAHLAVETAVKHHKLPELGPIESEALREDRGAFVTLRKNGELRGCIGYVSPILPLAETVRNVAASAAVEDTRFPPVRPEELPLLDYEISVLSPMQRVESVKEIQVGRDGLFIKQGPYEGVLLPQVAVEEGWDRTTFLEQTCRKAGLLEDCWRDSRTDIFRFSALVLTEKEPKPAGRAPGKPRS